MVFRVFKHANKDYQRHVGQQEAGQSASVIPVKLSEPKLSNT